MKKKLMFGILGLGIILAGVSVMQNLRSDEQNVQEQQTEREEQSSVNPEQPSENPEQSSESQPSSEQNNQEQESGQTPVEEKEPIATPQQSLTYIPEEYNWAGEDISETLFQLVPEKFLFASGAGAWCTALNINEDGTFSGNFHDSDGNTVYICDFTGSFTKPVKVDDYTYSLHIESIDYPEPGQEYDENNVHYITSRPYGLENADEIRIYIPGYPVSELPQEARQWLNGSSSAFWKTIKPEILSFFALYNVNDQQAFSSEPLWESTVRVQLQENQYCDERFFQERVIGPDSESELV